VASSARLLLAYLRFNIASNLEYRGAFAMQALGMAVNDALFFVFWLLYFDRFPSVGGWGLSDVLLVTGHVATSFGLASILFGNARALPQLIEQGQLDYYLGKPKPVLLHTLVSRSSLSSWGDVAFGLVALAITLPPDPLKLLLWLVLMVCSGLLFIAFQVIGGSLAFFAGNAEGVVTVAEGTIVNFSFYPGGIYQGWVKVLVFTLIPAGFAAHVPVSLLREFDPVLLLGTVGFTGVFTALAVGVFTLTAEALRVGQSGVDAGLVARRWLGPTT
jgi:ABC-2 type transport system permease protein